MEITQSGQQTENQMKKHESNIRDLWDNIKRANLRIIGIPEGVEKDKGMENIFEEIITGNFLNLKDTDIKIHEAQRAPNKLNPNRLKPQSGILDKKTKPSICYLQETHLRAKDTYRLKVRGWEKIFHANGQDRKEGVANLISDKIDLKTKAVKKDKEGQNLMAKGLIQVEDITIVNIYAPNIGAPR